MKLDLTGQEGQMLVNLINIAVKTVGLEGAELGLYFFSKIKSAQEQEEAEKAKAEADKVAASKDPEETQE